MKKKECKCLIFDCDNVLVDTETTFISVLIDLASKYGAEIEIEDAIRKFSGVGIHESIAILQHLAIEKFPDNFEETFRRAVYEEFIKGVQPIEGVESLLAILKIPFCVASSGPLEKINLNLRLSGLEKFFDSERIFSCYDIGKWKPSPEIFLHAADRMGFLPHECIVVEDSIAGVKAAVAGGFKVYGLSDKHTSTILKQLGAIPFFYMEDLPKLILSESNTSII